MQAQNRDFDAKFNNISQKKRNILNKNYGFTVILEEFYK